MEQETVDVENIAGIQTIHIPGNLKINDDKVFLKKIGEIIYIIPYNSPWKKFYENFEAVSPDFMEDRDQQMEQERESLD